MEVCFRFCFCFKQKTAYEMRISDWSSDVCSSDLGGALFFVTGGGAYARLDNKFTTTNAANSFDDNGKTNAWGYAAGGGAEVMVTNNIRPGLESLSTAANDKTYVVIECLGDRAPAHHPISIARETARA